MVALKCRYLLLYLLIAVLSRNCAANEDEVSSDKLPDAEHDTVVVENVEYKTPQIDDNQSFVFEAFDEENEFERKWVKSQTTKAESDEYKYDGEWALIESNHRVKGDLALVMQSKARHHAIGTRLRKKFEFNGQKLVVQYEVQFKNGQECGGAYLKLLSSPSGNLNELNDKTAYSLMFGPDKCGNDYKLHFIFNHKNPLNGTLREIHWKKASSVNKLDDVVKDGKWHLFRLVISPDNTYEIEMDRKVVGKGSLHDDFNPQVNPPKEVDDPNDTKPEDWDEREKIADPEAVKPEDWDENEPRKITDPNAKKPSDWLEEEPENIADPEASKPTDWDPDMDGEWEPPLISNPKCSKAAGCGVWKAPLVDNPKYKGKWKPPLINNPNFKGKWAPRKIPNPDFFEDASPYKMLPIDAVAFELWTISNEISFDNVLISNNVDIANYISDNTYQIKKDLMDAENDNWFLKLVKYTNKNPWLWVVYLILFAIPLVLFIGYCCVSPGKGNRDEAKQMAEDLLSNEESTKFGFGGDEPPVDEEESRVNEEQPSCSQDSMNELNEDDIEVMEEDDDNRFVDGEDKDFEERVDEEEESKPRLRKMRPRKEN